MRTEVLRFVTEVYSTKSMTSAANNLNITPQGLGKAIQTLEKELGVKLFERTFDGMVPSAACNLLIGKFREIVAAEQDIQEIVRQAEGMEDNQEVFVISANTIGVYVEQAVIEYNRKHGKRIQILQIESSDEITERAFLDHNYTYRYICREANKNVMLQRDDLVQLHFALMVGPGNPLTRKLKVGYEDLSGMTLLVERKHYVHVQVLLSTFEKHKIKAPDLRVCTNSLELIAMKLETDPNAVYFARFRDLERMSRFQVLDFQPAFYITLCLEENRETPNRELIAELREKLKHYNTPIDK